MLLGLGAVSRGRLEDRESSFSEWSTGKTQTLPLLRRYQKIQPVLNLPVLWIPVSDTWLNYCTPTQKQQQLLISTKAVIQE